jgi:hypothetical protein
MPDVSIFTGWTLVNWQFRPMKCEQNAGGHAPTKLAWPIIRPLNYSKESSRQSKARFCDPGQSSTPEYFALRWRAINQDLRQYLGLLCRKDSCAYAHQHLLMAFTQMFLGYGNYYLAVRWVRGYRV